MHVTPQQLLCRQIKWTFLYSPIKNVLQILPLLAREVLGMKLIYSITATSVNGKECPLFRQGKWFRMYFGKLFRFWVIWLGGWWVILGVTGRGDNAPVNKS